MKAHFATKDQFGTKTYVPTCAVSRALSNIAGTKTLRMHDMKIAEADLGIEWVFRPADQSL